MISAQSGRTPDSMDSSIESVIEKSDNKDECENVNTSEEYKYFISQGIKNFVEKLNANAKCGYKLEKLTKFPLSASENFDQMILAAVVKLDLPNRYEYDWFEAFTPGEVVTRINFRVKKGFYFYKTLPLAQGTCDNIHRDSSGKSDTEKIYDNLVDLVSFSLGDIYFLERKEEATIQPEYRMLVGAVGWGKKPTETLQRSLDDKVKQGFQPVSMSSYKVGNNYGLSILVEKKGETLKNAPLPQYQIIRSEFGFEKKVNRHAKKGFRLVFAGEMWAFRHSLMLKDSKRSSPLSYKWVDATRKSYLNKFSDLAIKGIPPRFVYSRIYGCDYSENQLIFEQQPNSDQIKTDFKVLNLTDKMQRRISIGEEVDDFLSPSEERTQEFQKLLSDGYKISDLFYANGVNIVLRRQEQFGN